MSTLLSTPVLFTSKLFTDILMCFFSSKAQFNEDEPFEISEEHGTQQFDSHTVQNSP